jgi:hypothetical protein
MTTEHHPTDGPGAGAVPGAINDTEGHPAIPDGGTPAAEGDASEGGTPEETSGDVAPSETLAE